MTIDDPELLSGTKLGMTCIDGVLRYAWTEAMIPITKRHIPEVQPEVQLANGVREDFRLWRYEIRQRAVLTRPLLNLAMREVELIAAQD